MRSISIMRTLPIWILTVTAAVIGGAAADPMVPSGNPGETAPRTPGKVGGVVSHSATHRKSLAQTAFSRQRSPSDRRSLPSPARTSTFPALYDGLYTPPVLRVQPGDTVRLLLNNFAQLPTNVHYHGFNVTPQEGGDDIYISIDQGDSFQYDFPIPAHHRQGLYWYHPHRDPLLNTQIAGGMAGGIIIGDVLAPFPSLQGIPERVMLLKDLKTEGGFPVEDPDPNGPTKRTINGLFKPRLEMRPGQLEFWRIGNQSSNIFYQLSLGGQTLPYHGDGRQPAEPGRRDADAPSAARQPARGARVRTAERHLPASRRSVQHRPGG